MKYQVLGPRVLLKIKKIRMKEFLEKKKYIEGSTLIEAPEVDNRKEALELDIVTQTSGEVVGLGNEAFKKTETGVPWVQIGDQVRFMRYGAQRVSPEDDEDFEYWVINDKDILAKETQDNV